MLSVYPERRIELDTYLAIISDLAISYGGTLFYEYHKSSAKAALYIQKLADISQGTRPSLVRCEDPFHTRQGFVQKL